MRRDRPDHGSFSCPLPQTKPENVDLQSKRTFRADRSWVKLLSSSSNVLRVNEVNKGINNFEINHQNQNLGINKADLFIVIVKWKQCNRSVKMYLF